MGRRGRKRDLDRLVLTVRLTLRTRAFRSTSSRRIHGRAESSRGVTNGCEHTASPTYAPRVNVHRLVQDLVSELSL